MSILGGACTSVNDCDAALRLAGLDIPIDELDMSCDGVVLAGAALHVIAPLH